MLSKPVSVKFIGVKNPISKIGISHGISYKLSENIPAHTCWCGCAKNPVFRQNLFVFSKYSSSCCESYIPKIQNSREIYPYVLSKNSKIPVKFICTISKYSTSYMNVPKFSSSGKIYPYVSPKYCSYCETL